MERMRQKKQEAEEAGMVYVYPEPPRIINWEIMETGLVPIYFNTDMREIKDLSVIKES